jgi:hypothetical protein
MNEKARFAERLKAALIAAGHEPRPGVLHKQFNSQYWGKSVSFQGARGWLVGLSIPEQDKLQVLAEWLNVEPQALRFGEQAARWSKNKEKSGPWPSTLKPQDRATIEKLLSLPASRRRLVSDLIKELAAD